MERALTPIENSKTQRLNATKNFNNTMIADRLRTVSWSDDNRPTGEVKPTYGIPTFPLAAKSM